MSMRSFDSGKGEAAGKIAEEAAPMTLQHSTQMKFKRGDIAAVESAKNVSTEWTAF